MSYSVIPKQTPHVPELDWDQAITQEVKPSDVPAGGTSTAVFTSPTGGMPYSGVACAIIRSSWTTGTSTQATATIHVIKAASSVGYPPDSAVIWSRSAGGSAGCWSIFSKGDYMEVLFSRYGTASDSAYIYFMPWKGQTVPAQGGE